MTERFDLLARFRAFLNLVMAASLCARAKERWKAEGWQDGYHFELTLINDGKTYDQWHEEYMNA